MADAKQSTFAVLNKMNVNDHVQKKMSLSYLSWVWAWQTIKSVDANATKEFTQFDEYDPNAHQLTGRKVDYMLTPQGGYVECTVTINGIKETEQLPIMDYKNKAIPNPTMMDINKTKQRCFVKACALHGLGLYIYAGEDLPEKQEEKKSTSKSKRPSTDNTNLASETMKNKVVKNIKDFCAATDADNKTILKNQMKVVGCNAWDNLTTKQAQQIINNLITALEGTTND